MSFESNKVEETPDRTKRWWLIVAGLFVVMLLGLWLMGPVKPSRSEVTASHILIKADLNNPAEKARALERLKELKQQLDGIKSPDELKKTFAELAEKYSEDPYSATKGGDLGPAKKGTYQGDFEEYVWKGPIGQVSGIIRTGFGYHLVLITKRYLTDVDKHLREQEEKIYGESGAPDAPTGQ